MAESFDRPNGRATSPQPPPTDIITTHPVKNGLLLRRAGQDLPFKSYTYCPSRPLASGVGSIEWCPLSFFHLEGAHIRLYNLRQDGLTGIIEECSKSRPRALVIVNEKDSLKLNQDQSELLQDFDDCLVVILSSSAGSNLLGLEDLDDVEAKINVTSSTNTQLVVDDVGVDVIDIDTTVPSSTSGRPEHQNKGFMNKLFGGSKTATFDLKGEIKKLMFEGDKMKPVTLDAGLFTVIMSSFSQYEKTPKPDSNQISFIIRQYLMAGVDVSFYAEFPFYLMVIYRFRHYRSHYQSEDVGPLTTKCINMFESLPPDQITKTLSKFFKQKDFDIMYDEVNTSVFQLLAISCRDLLNTSIQIKNAQPNQSSGGVIYARLLWISVYLKCLSEKGLATPHEGEMWQNFLLKESMVKNILLTKEILDEFKKGLELSAMLNLPQEVKFTSHHMTNFLGGEKFIRPFCRVKDFIVTLETYIRNDRELVVHVLINLRSFYTQFLNSSDPQEICKASENGTILGVIDEGISFLDAMTELWHKRGWHKGEMNDDFRQVCLKWLNLLLSIIKVTDPNAPQLLKKFLAQKMHSIISDKEFRNHITAEILRVTREAFPHLTIQLFFSLYKPFRIWPMIFLQDYLDQYVVLPNVKISDATWSEFFKVVLERFPNQEPQHSLFHFLCKVSKQYKDSNRPDEFIPDLLKLDVPQLFVSNSNSDGDGDGEAIGLRFSDFLKSYIMRNNLNKSLLVQIQSLVALMTDDVKHLNFHWIILNVLQSVIIPELKSYDSSEHLQSILTVCVNSLCQNIQWFNQLSPRQRFCWGVVATTCSKFLLTADNFDWIHSSLTIIQQLGVVFNTYCNSRKLYDERCLLADHTPDEILTCQFEDVRKYFDWVRAVQDILRLWQSKFFSNKINYDDLLLYASNNVSLSTLGRAVVASGFVMDLQSISQIKDTYMYNFEQLNIFLLRYVPSHPEVKYCTLTSLLSHYGVAIPPEVRNVIIGHILFPGEDNIPSDQLLHNVIPPSTSSRIFEPGQEITLVLSKAMKLSDLQILNENLEKFLSPLMDCIDMLIFFHLHQSEMFVRHLLKKLQTLTDELSSPQKPERSGFSLVTTLRPTMTSFARRDHHQGQISEGVPMKIFQRALELVKDLFLKILKGTATYSDIIAEGAMKLESINTDKEFSILKSYSETLEMASGNYQGLQGVRSMLELFQFTQHIQTIDAVCEQYGLENCRKDETLKELLKIMNDLRPEGSRAKLTPLEATDKMDFIRRALCLQGASSYKCLDLFPAVANSAAFYQFIRDKQFVGTRGQTIFQEQYQLITAQLQHEEYDENVLNHLRAAFEFLAPFMEQDISFGDLMSRVTRLDTTHGLKQLETVNENITLIRLWFSRAEGDTLENVANELDNILSTGLYHFQLSGQQTFLIYQSAGKGNQRRHTPQPTPLEESDKQEPLTLLTPQPITLPISNDHPLAAGCTMGNGGIEQRWSSEQIADFVRKLGFLDADGEGGEKIKVFLHLNETANKLMDFYVKLRELGHPSYQEFKVLPALYCNINKEAADAIVQSLEATFNDWTTKVVDLRQHYTWLLFFSVPKILHLYSLVEELSVDLDAIVREISFLFENDLLVRRKLKPVVQEALAHVQTSEDITGSPMHILGEFLQKVCSSQLLEQFLLKQRSSSKTKTSTLPRPTSLSIAYPVASGSQMGQYQLHFAPGYSHKQLLCLITELYQGVPEPFEVFRCRSDTTREELNLFIERIRHHPLPYLVIHVNKLSFKQQELLMSLPKDNHNSNNTTIHFIETSQSTLREVPWVTYREYKPEDLSFDFEEAARQCRRKIIRSTDFTCIQLVIGNAGDGKTHYIRSQMSLCPTYLTISVNESFTPLSAIRKLNTLPTNTTGCAIFFNFTLMPYPYDGQDPEERQRMVRLMETVSWFFFDLLILGYVEDPVTGLSFRIPGGLEWAVYVEVPSLDRNSRMEDSLALFYETVPSLGLLGSPHPVHSSTHYNVDDDVQLVCKYLRAFKNVNSPLGINKLYREAPHGYVSGHASSLNKIVKFSTDEPLSHDDCHKLLSEYMPDHIQMNKMTQKLFIKYMKRRCGFLDTNPAFNYNTGVGEPILINGTTHRTDTSQLGSTLMATMLEEVTNFCHPSIQQNWSDKPHQQLIYDFRDGGGSFGLLSLNNENLSEENKKKFSKIGFELHSTLKLQDRRILDQYLARALGVPSEEDGSLSVIDECRYVLTLDYTIKMLNIHERYECGIPVIIKGETGVGKTALVEMLSKLWSRSLLHVWRKERGNIFDALRKLMAIKADESIDTYQLCLETVQSLTAGKDVSLDDLTVLCELSDVNSTSGQFYTRLRDLLLDMANNPASALLKLPRDKGKKKEENEINRHLDQYFELARRDLSSRTTALLLQQVLRAHIKNTFHKLNVHAALTPTQIKEFFEPVFLQAIRLRKAYEKADQKKRSKVKMPFVTVFLDEVNTSSCLGLFKEILVDRTLDGDPIPDNLFMVAACNPHRGNSMATHAAETWVRSSYYVRPLHPTLEFLIWDYGSLDEYKERDYIRVKLQMLHQELPNIEVVTLTDLIVESQSLMRRYAARQLRKQGMNPEDVEVSSHSCVSQRDIQRVFTFYQWLVSIYNRKKQHGERRDYNRRALMVSLGIVYYMRLNSEYREDYRRILDKKCTLPNEVNFTKAFFSEMDWFCDNIELPPGIAKTRALKENLFATIVCTVTHTPLIIVGAPGSSKTLSFNLTISNLKGPESKKETFRDVDIFKSLDPHFYQCSRRTTSNEVQTVFSRAINRQYSHAKFSLPIYCVVFMDEAGLPEESHESLKVLHYHLDKQEVSFVAITNHVLDAAKTNRAVSLFRPEVSEEDLKVLAKGCLCQTPENPPPELKQDLNIIVQFCPAYMKIMERDNMNKFFGLRDFIHFVNYLRRRRGKEMLTPKLVQEGLERNFNGIYWAEPGEEESFKWLCNVFLKKMQGYDESQNKRSLLDVLHSSLKDRPERGGGENEVRYKLIIDPSEDNSLVQLLMTFKVLDRKKTHVYVCSDFPGDSQLQKINTIAAIRHSAIVGHTVVMSQTDDIHESFYDLFNQRFRMIDDPKLGPRYYANIAIGAHLKPCRVHQDFQCVIVIRKSEIKNTPAPFLNRFEKYYISHRTLLDTSLNHLPPCVKIILRLAYQKVNEFIKVVDGPNSLYGLKEETLDSLLLSLLPPYGHTYCDTPPGEPIQEDIKLYLLRELLRSLRNSAGFAVPKTTVDELANDADYLFPILFQDSSFEGAFQSLTQDSAHQAVSQALKVLHTAPDPHEEGVVMIDVPPSACLVISLLQQWLIRHMIKELMKLMTSEAVTLHRKKIPTSYIDNYLTYQQHFSLKKLLDLQLRALQSCDGDTNLCGNKLLTFTRSSSLIHSLPSQYSLIPPSSIAIINTPTQSTSCLLPADRDENIISELIYQYPTVVSLCKLSAVQSQANVQDMLKTFVHSPTKQIFVLIVNMQEAKSEIVNHIRVMIEEAELQAPPGSCKLFALILHFPPVMFFNACYPSLFLRGWSHYYIDSIGHSQLLNPATLDIEQWFQRCCFTDKVFQDDTLMNACSYLQSEIIPVLASQVVYGTRSNGPFTRHMKASERKNKLRELLETKGVGQCLQRLFRTLWRPPVMTDYLEKAALFTRTYESSLNITDTVQTMFKSAFTEFMIIMLTRMNEGRNLDVLFEAKSSQAVQDLFIDMIPSISVPKLDQLKTLANSIPHPKPQSYHPSFPFFNLVYKEIQVLIDDSRKVKGESEKMLEEGDGESLPSLPSNDDNVLRSVVDLVTANIQRGMDAGGVVNPVHIFISHLNKSPDDLWARYFIDFLHHCLHLETTTSSLSYRIICAFFSELFAIPPHQRLVYLHTYFEYNKISLGNIASLLRPLEKIWKVSEGTPASFLDVQSIKSPAEKFIEAVEETKYPFGNPKKLSEFVISALFSAVVGSLFPPKSQDGSEFNQDFFMEWYNTYHHVMSMSALRVHLYSIPLYPNEQAKFNIMHCTFLYINSFSQPTKDSLVKSTRIFYSLLSKYFKRDLNLKNDQNIPGLAECMNTLTEIAISSDSSSLQEQELKRLIFEGLLEHFFSEYKLEYPYLDIDWFLKLANQQQQWRASNQLLNEAVVSISYSGDLVSALDASIKKNRYRSHMYLEVPSDCISIFTYKKYLTRILGQCEQGDSAPSLHSNNPLLMYRQEIREHLAEILSCHANGEEPTNYIPVFYQDCKMIGDCSKLAENSLMQQPLCHLYFLTLMENLDKDIKSLVRLIETINQLCRPLSVSVGDRILLNIEKQAVIQCLLKNVAQQFNYDCDKPIVFQNFTEVIGELNDIIEDDKTGGGMIGGHRLTLGMHLLRHLKSARKFTDLLNEKFPSLEEIKCINYFHQQLKSQVDSKPYLFPFMQADDNSTILSKLYNQVKTAMLNVDNGRGSQAAVDQLLKIADECYKPVSSKISRVTAESSFNIDRKQTFKMMVWLVAYYEFFVTKKASKITSQVIGNQLKPYLKEEGVIKIIQCFLYPKFLVQCQESPLPLREDATLLEVLPNGRVKQVQREGSDKVDPLFELFLPPRLAKRDQSDIDLCHCVANLVAVIIGCQPQTNHLWYHLFAPHELRDTYMTGFMYKSKISPEGLLYDCGVELTADGQYGRPDYIKHATRGTYTLHSLYFLLWANFGSFCASMLTETTSQSKIHGVLISDWQAIRHYCTSQLKTTWSHLRDNLSISDEERSFLVTRCLMNIYEMSNRPDCPLTHGRFRNAEELDEYESLWHERVFTPAWEELKEKFMKYSLLWQNQLFINIRHLEVCYPQYPTEKDFINFIQGHNLMNEGDLRLLTQFSLEKERIEVGGQLLPDLIEFYQWIHIHLSHLITRDRAYNKLTIGKVITLAAKKGNPILLALYNKVKDNYNRYVQLVGGAIGQGACAAVRRGNKIYTLDDDLPFIHFLSDSQDEGEGNDWLFAVIKDIAESQNLLVHTLYADVGGDLSHPLRRLLPKEPSSIYATEANEHSCIIGRQRSYWNMSHLLQLIRSRLEPINSDHIPGTPFRATQKLMSITGESSVPISSLSFYLSQLQADVVYSYLSGKPLISDVSSLRIVFQFRDEAPPIIRRQISDPMSGAYSITSLIDSLSPSLRLPLPQAKERQLEFEFHSASYHLLTEIVVGLRTAIGHMIKVIPMEEEISQDILDMTLKQFMLNEYDYPTPDITNVFIEIGIKSLSNSQIKCLQSFRLPYLYSILTLFLDWVKDGTYDFSGQPLALKVHLSQEDVSSLDNIIHQFPGSTSQLLSELKGLNEVLLHVEAHLIKEVNEQAMKPLMELLKELGLLDTEQILNFIPSTVLVQHYVKFRCKLRNLINGVEQRMSVELSVKDYDTEQWVEQVDDLWIRHLTHLKDEGFAYIDPTLIYNPFTGCYGFFDDSEESDNADITPDNVSELACDLNKDDIIDVYNQDSFEPISMDFNDPMLFNPYTSFTTLAGGSGPSSFKGSTSSGPTSSIKSATVIGRTSSVHETLKQGLDDPLLRDQMIKMISLKQDIQQHAREWTPDMISSFLERINLVQYAWKFQDEDINGSQLLSADREVFNDLGVVSLVHSTIISVKFRRELQGLDDSTYNMADLVAIKPKLAQFEKTLKSVNIDVDMLLYALQNQYLSELLKECGITKALDNNRFEDALNELQLVPASPTTPTGRASPYVAYSTPV